MTLCSSDDIERMIRRCKRALDRDGTRRELEIRSYAKPSERRKAKIRARMKRRKREKMQEDRESPNLNQPSWRFILRDGQYVKVPSKREEMHQAIRKES